MTTTPRANPWWTPHVHADRRPLLMTRNRIKAAIGAWFGEADFVEVECGVLQRSPGNEAHLHAFATERVFPDGRHETLYLHTSPEFSAKKLLAAGEERIYSLGPVFRNRELGPRHACEFTMLEWYRAGEPYHRLMEDCAELVALAATAANTNLFRHRGLEADPFAVPRRVSVAEAFAHHAGIDLLATIAPDGSVDRDGLATQAEAAAIRVAFDDSWSDIFSRIIVEKVEPHLGIGRATILCEYPVVEAALARPKPEDPRVTERFELYVCGVELANGFGELTDPQEQRRRFIAEMDEKERVYGERYPIDEDFIAALAIMPEASGIALGFDRLVMLATGAPRLDMVVWTPATE
ncbi:EF-P lysine aminoacylase EpmA [Kaistia dalseonensis]|uniref:Lysyl-tRNA synthetase class 2 n=1 Tax=Kaistia dalseonensis TaxID=410840 RepID=A0ABU0H369_9HYPH|nr:EF-P lysine aminoacylase EpmA [Kaistia dalseonensis]MCX5494170.1 EF-P lysine aminoacylase EpmA [Kaistia dalseonensis]MDQ0436749.1 lysyl-tRNA synthetase class 2 [Kaistia dalseonensis]